MYSVVLFAVFSRCCFAFTALRLLFVQPACKNTHCSSLKRFLWMAFEEYLLIHLYLELENVYNMIVCLCLYTHVNCRIKI